MPAPGWSASPPERSEGPSLRLTVDGETFQVHFRADGSCRFDWISGPNEGYGFSSSGSSGSAPTEAELREDIRTFLAQIDPSTGYLDEREGQVTEARLHDGSTIELSIRGSGPAVLLPVRTEPRTEEEAEQLRLWGADPDAGRNLFNAIADAGFTAVAADYEAHRMANPAPTSLTPDNVSADLLAIADAAGAERFAYAGYSWTALVGLQLALRTDRLWALVMGGYPPVAAPYREMLAVTRAARAASVESGGPQDTVDKVTPGDWDSAQIQTSPAQTEQFVTLYESLQDFDDAAASARLTIPRLAYAGDADEIEYSERWGGVTVRIAGPLRAHRRELETQGWRVELLPGRDHLAAMHSDVAVPLLTSWLRSVA